MAQIFISYRRSDSQANTDRIYAQLVKAFGRKMIFKDVDDIPPGVDFPTYLENKVRDAKIVLIIIGKQWANAAYEDGSLRLNDPEDFVRIELELALSMGNALVIPVLVNNAPMPSPNQLPASIRSITRLNAMQVRNDPDFDNDSRRLVRKLREVRLSKPVNIMPWLAMGLVLVVGIGSLFASNLLNGAGSSTPTTEVTTEVALVATTAAPLPNEPTETSTLTGFQLVQTAEAGITQAYETQVVLNQTVTREFALSSNGTATALQFGVTETAAYGTLNALSARPTFTSHPTEQATATNTNIPPTPTNRSSATPETPTATNTSESTLIPEAFEEIFQLASTPIASNNTVWEELYPNGFLQEFDGVPMVLVPTGCFQMGNDPNAFYVAMMEVPDGGEQCFQQPFWIDQTEVTQGDFERLGGDKENTNSYHGINRPIEHITWFEADTFCRLRGGRLPTEAEWEYVARGPDALFYPWGYEPGNWTDAVWWRSDDEGTANVGSILTGTSWVGAFDMSGNVAEWTNTLFDSYPYVKDDGREFGQFVPNVGRIVRGGSWLDNSIAALRSSARFEFGPHDERYTIGFRCVRF